MAKKKTNNSPTSKSVTLQWVPFGDLVFLENNPRTRTDEGKRKMAADIERDPVFYENRPTLVNLVNGEYRVYAGDLRAHAAHEVLGWPLIPCNVEADVPPELMRSRAILDNTHREEFDPTLLAEWGYEPEELEEMGVWLADDSEEGEGGVPNNALNSEKVEEDDFEAPEIEEIKTDIVLGDLFEIGPHRLLCGDSTKAEDVERVMGGAKADLIVTDPPYGVDYSGGIQFSPNGDVKKDQREKLANDDSEQIYADSIPIMAAITQGPIYTWFADSKAGTLYNSIKKVGEIHALIIWVKNGGYGALNANYKQRHEPCLYWKPKNGRLNFVGATTENTIWEISKDGRNEFHPTQKPVALAAKALLNHDAKSVADLFLGSGTTMVAAHQLNRKCYGMELEPKYVSVCLKRMKKLDNSLEIKCLNRTFDIEKELSNG
jgi:DNA modification methylase